LAWEAAPECHDDTRCWTTGQQATEPDARTASIAEELEALALGAGEEQDQAGGVDEGAVEGLGSRGARLAGAAGGAEHDAAVFGEQELPSPGFGEPQMIGFTRIETSIDHRPQCITSAGQNRCIK
jgi:hypothetical protein